MKYKEWWLTELLSAEISRSNWVQISSVEKMQGFQGLNTFQQFWARLSASALQMAHSFWYLDVEKIWKIIDFGAWSWWPTFGIKSLNNSNWIDIIALEQNCSTAKEITATWILQQDKIVTWNWIEYLIKWNGDCDLITAFMLWPDLSWQLFTSLANASVNSLSSSGNLLITSDYWTYSKVAELLNMANVKYQQITGITEWENIIVPNTIIIPKESCKMLSCVNPLQSANFITEPTEERYREWSIDTNSIYNGENQLKFVAVNRNWIRYFYWFDNGKIEFLIMKKQWPTRTMTQKEFNFFKSVLTSELDSDLRLKLETELSSLDSKYFAFEKEHPVKEDSKDLWYMTTLFKKTIASLGCDDVLQNNKQHS